MHFKQVFATLSLLTLTSALTLPENLADGGYTLDYDKDGNTVVTSLSTGESTTHATLPIAPRNVHAARGEESGCTQVTYDHGDYQNSVDQLKNYCDNGNKVISKATVWSHSNAKVYICNYGGEQPCSGNEWDSFNGRMDQNCGAWQGAWIYVADWAKTLGRDAIGRNICVG